jgi:hypothetical protein
VRQNASVPASTADRRLLLFTAFFVAAAGVLVAVLLFLATGGGGADPQATPLFIGLDRQLRNNINADGPQYIANPFGGNGFWLDVEGDHVVAYNITLPTTTECHVKWKAQRDSYVDCNGDDVERADLDQFKVFFRNPNSRNPDVMVDLRVDIPAQGSDSG